MCVSYLTCSIVTWSGSAVNKIPQAMPVNLCTRDFAFLVPFLRQSFFERLNAWCKTADQNVQTNISKNTSALANKGKPCGGSAGVRGVQTTLATASETSRWAASACGSGYGGGEGQGPSVLLPRGGGGGDHGVGRRGAVGRDEAAEQRRHGVHQPPQRAAAHPAVHVVQPRLAFTCCVRGLGGEG